MPEHFHHLLFGLRLDVVYFHDDIGYQEIHRHMSKNLKKSTLCQKVLSEASTDCEAEAEERNHVNDMH